MLTKQIPFLSGMVTCSLSLKGHYNLFTKIVSSQFFDLNINLHTKDLYAVPSHHNGNGIYFTANFSYYNKTMELGNAKLIKDSDQVKCLDPNYYACHIKKQVMENKITKEDQQELTTLLIELIDNNINDEDFFKTRANFILEHRQGYTRIIEEKKRELEQTEKCLAYYNNLYIPA